MTAEQILMYDLGTDALKYIERAVLDLSLADRVKVAAQMAAGAPFELRIRMWGTGRHPSFSLVQIVGGKESVLHTTAKPGEAPA